MPSTEAIDWQLLDAGLLIVRVSFGLAYAAHGAQKLFGWFGGYGLAGTGGFLESLGYRPGKMFAAVVGLGELVGGLLFAVGFLGAVGPALMLAGMLVAIVTVHLKNGFFVTSNGIEHPLMVATAAVGIALTGPGRYSVDGALGGTIFETPLITLIVLLIGLVGGLLNLVIRRPPTTAPSI
ncbi:MAG TPA: DoxX family protein [Gemmatimonadaceae bacterium]|nr:DoxX family protein [Gemmatimonadaceae bacterium]